jgi:predicted nucleic acid-binding protein
MVVIDASVLATALRDDAEEGARARTRIRGESLVAPEIIDLEVSPLGAHARR